MNRNSRVVALTLASLLALTPLASAQQSPPTRAGTGNGQPGTMQPGAMPPRAGQGLPAGQMPAAFALVRRLGGLSVIGRNPKTAFSKAQAARLAVLLEPLKTAKTLTAAQASSVSASLDQLLTPAQRSALRLAESQMGGGRGPGGRIRGGQVQGAQGQPGQVQGAQQGDTRSAGTPNGGPQGDRAPTGQAPTGQAPTGQAPTGQAPTGQAQDGHRQAGQGQSGPMNMAPDGNPFLSPRGGQVLSTLLGSLHR
ncbi:hypothetical protein [Deinococcus sp.]|uniref:hypothetical protein n=1 Tax=Deinococcus sp. TaxID=47478 RepID=UPI003C7B2236